jgi:predicted ATPase
MYLLLNIAEIFRGMDKPVKIRSMHSSDGILRMVAIAALAEMDKDTGVILLDEIEDGINPYLAARIVTDLKEISEKKQRQVVVTTHSSVVLDYFPAESVVFLWRDKQGTVKSSSLFENEEVKASLEYMYPGEVWINMDEEEIIKKLQDKK